MTFLTWCATTVLTGFIYWVYYEILFGLDDQMVFSSDLIDLKDSERVKAAIELFKLYDVDNSGLNSLEKATSKFNNNLSKIGFLVITALIRRYASC